MVHMYSGKTVNNFEVHNEEKVTYVIEDGKIHVYFEDGIDFFGNGNVTMDIEMPIIEKDGNIYLVLNITNGYYNFSYYTVKEK